MTTFSELYSEVLGTPEYLAAGVKLDVALMLESIMEAKKISKAELAKQLGCSKPYVTNMLRGDSNFSILTLAKVATALGCELRIQMTPRTCVEDIYNHKNILEFSKKNISVNPIRELVQSGAFAGLPGPIPYFGEEIEYEPEQLAA